MCVCVCVCVSLCICVCGYVDVCSCVNVQTYKHIFMMRCIGTMYSMCSVL